GSPATHPSQHLIRIGNGPPTAACRIESTSAAAPDDLGLLVWDSRPRAALLDIDTSSPQREPEASSASKLRCRRRRPGFRKGIPLRNDENQVCSRSAQPPHVPVDRSSCGN